MIGRPALFLDRDGTLTLPFHHPTHPSQLKLSPGIGAPLRQADALGYKLIVVTNQSVVARGLLTEEGLQHMHDHLRGLLRQCQVEIDAVYSCPHHPNGTVPRYARHCHCRKPAPGLILSAAHDFGIDLDRSCMIGDAVSDMQAAEALGLAAVHIRGDMSCVESGSHWHANNTADGIALALERLSHDQTCTL